MEIRAVIAFIIFILFFYALIWPNSFAAWITVLKHGLLG